MAKAVINLQKESGGIVKISPVYGEVVPETVVLKRTEAREFIRANKSLV